MNKIAIAVSIALFSASAVMAADGESLYKTSCVGCHGADGGKSVGGMAPLKGLGADTIFKRLQGYADGTYGGEHKAVMHEKAKKFSVEELKALADYAGKF